MTIVSVVSGTVLVALCSILQSDGRPDVTVIVVKGAPPFIGFTEGAESACGCCWTVLEIA